jgi:capsular exopolysaccharide synthesis family protein
MNQAPIQPQYDPFFSSTTELEPIDLRAYWRIVRKHLAGIIGLAIAVGILALLIANSGTPVYTATTKISIEQVTPKTIGLNDLSFYSMRNYPGTQYELIKSRSVAEKVVENLRLWEYTYFDTPPKPATFSIAGLIGLLRGEGAPKEKLSPEQKEERLKGSLISMVQGGIRISPIEDTYIVRLSFSSPDPKLAADVANAVVDAFITQKYELRYEELQKVSKWMDESLGDVNEKLESSQVKLQEFRNRESIVNIGEGGATDFMDQRLGQISSSLLETRVKVNELRNLKRQVGRFKDMSMEEVLNNQSIYKHPTLSELKNKEIETSRRVRELANRYGPKHPKMIEANKELEIIQARYRELIPGVIRGIDEDYSIARQNLASLQREYDALKKEVQTINKKEFELQKLQSAVESNQRMQELFLEELKQTRMTSSFEMDKVRVIEPAMVPGGPSAPNKNRFVMMAVLTALMVGVGLAFLVEYLDQTLKTSEDIESKLSLPTLGLLPQLSKRDIKKGKITPERQYLDDEQSNYSEAIRTIRTGITLSAIDTPHKVILVTSSEPSEGKTTVACNTALCFSQLEKTLIFDADLRRPSTKHIFDYEHDSPGMSDLLTENAKYEDVIHAIEGTNLSVITAGTIPPDPLDLLASKKFKKLLETLAERFDRIIIDSPPVNIVSDAVLLASLADSVVFVIKSDDTNTKVVQSSIHKLKQSNAHIVGAVLNAVNMKKLNKYYGYGYGKNYADGYYSYDAKASS